MRIKTSIVVSILMTCAFLTCSKPDIPIRHDLAIASGQTLEFDLGGVPAEGSISIKQQALHYEVSQVDLNIYKYKSIENFKGTEYILIEKSGGFGDSSFYLTSLIEIEIRVN